MPGVTRTEYAEESAELEVLVANMDRLKGLTRKIQDSMDKLDTSGRSVQAAVNPIYSNTRKLQVTNANIDKINVSINRIREPLDRKRREEPIIKGGLKQVGLPDYLASLDRAQQALGDLKSSNLRSNQQAITELNGLLKLGSQQLEGAFREMLREESRTIEPLHYTTKNLPFPAISEEKSSVLRQINAFASHGSTDAKTAAIYSEVRSPYLQSSLQNLALATQGATRKMNPEAIYHKGTSGIGIYTEAIEGMFVAESNSIYPIFAREQWARLLHETCMGALDEFSKTLRELHTHIKNNLITDCFLAFEVVEVVTTLGYRLEAKARASDLKQPVQYAMRPIRETAKYSLQKLLEDTKGRIQGIVQLPQDGGSSQITSETIARLQAMTQHLEVLYSIFSSVGEGGWRPQNANFGSSVQSLDIGPDRGRELFTSYASDTIDSLLANLDAKAKVLIKQRAVQGVFLANNVAIVERMIATSELAPVINDAVRSRIETWRKKANSQYLDAWREPSMYLRDVQYTNRASVPKPSGPGQSIDSVAFVKALSSKEKEGTKEKFKNFTATFDELVQRHRTLRLEKEVKAQLAREVQAMLEPLYDRFWDRYHELDKGKGKVVKYDKAQLATLLASLG